MIPLIFHHSQYYGFIIMDPVRRLQLVRALIQLDDQQNIVVLQHQHQQVIRQRKLRQ